MAAPACQVIGGDGLAVQGIGDGGGDGQRLVGVALPAVVALHVLGVGQGGPGLLGGVGIIAAVLLADDDLLGAAVSVGDDVHGLTAAGGGGDGGGGLRRGGISGIALLVIVVGGKGGDACQTAHQGHRQRCGDELILLFHKLTS